MNREERENWIRCGFDPTAYAGIDDLQAEQIRYGLMTGVDVSQYDDGKYTANSMRLIRQALEYGLPQKYISI